MVATKKEYALNYFDNGLIPIPLCWIKEKRCGCFHHHTDPKQIGKAPLVSYANIEIKRETVERWFTKFPLANIGILIAKSGLVVVDADSKEAVDEVEEMIKTTTPPFVTTGRGKHFYFKRKTTTPLHRVIHTGKSEAIDIFSNGFVVAPPSTHMSGHQYVWSNPPKNTGWTTIPDEIEKALIKAKKEHVPDALPIVDKIKKVNLDDLPLNDFIKSLIRKAEQSPYYRERGYKSRSEAIFGIIIACIKSGVTDEEICSILLNPKNLISHRILTQEKSLSWLIKEISRAKKRVVSTKTTSKNTPITTKKGTY